MQANPIAPTTERIEDGVSVCAQLASTRLRAVLRRFFDTAADAIENDAPATAEKLCRATPHWLRHTHATHALGARSGTHHRAR